ncbi:prominin-2-like [Oncorhynchus nerka]|uniref:prominin-2-like n=1 Tax=Oncorhynchus nerka TaxID=8023 RepID=UPI001131A299|nr:prominin-2-like [Oncorhynchus nerka]
MGPRLSHGSWLWMFMSLLGAADCTYHCLSSSSDTQPFLSLTQTQTWRVESDGGCLKPLYNFAKLFLDSVQPNPFPEDIISTALKTEQLDIPQLVRYEAGYIVCLLLAVIYLLVMPVAGGVLAWRSFHGRKVEVNNTQSSSLASLYHQDIGVAACLVLVTILLLTGVILAFTVNSRVSENMHPGLYHVETSARIIEDSLTSITQKIKVIMEQYSIPKAEISKEMNDADDIIGATIISSFNTDVDEYLIDLSVSIEDAIGTFENLQLYQTTRTDLQANHTTLQNGIQGLQSRVESLGKCPTCDVPNPSNLTTVANYYLIPSVDDKLNDMPPASSLAGLIEQGNLTFHAIPQKCSEQVAPTIAALMSVLNESQEELLNTSHRFPSLESLIEAVSDCKTTVRRFADPVDYYDFVRWAVSLTLCMVMLVIVVLMVVALSLGLPVFFYPTIYSTYQDARLEHTAIGLYRAAVVASFVFSWLFILLVFIVLFFGGNAHTLGCRSWTHGQLFGFLDQQKNIFSSLNNISQSFNTSQSPNISQETNSETQQIQPSTSAIYHGCKSGQSLFHSMHMEQHFDLEDFLNASKYLDGFNETAQNMSVNLDGLKLLPDNGRQGLLSFKQCGIDSINYHEQLLLLSTPVVKTDLGVFANELDKKAEVPANGEIKEELKKEAETTRYLNTIVKLQQTNAAKMSQIVSALKTISTVYKANVDKALESLTQTEVALHNQLPYIVGNVSQCIMEKGEQSLLRYLDWVRHAILYNVLDCHWLAVSLDNVYTAVCLNVVDPLNAFWLCLGWCCAFLVPGVIFSIYTARRLKPEPTFISKDTFILPEKKTENMKCHTEKAASNNYMSLEEVHEMSMVSEYIKSKKCED